LDKLSFHNKLRPEVSLLVIIFLTFIHVTANDFINFDDSSYAIIGNPLISEFSWKALKTVFTQSTAGFYDPIYILSNYLDYLIWGLNPAGFHLDNLIIHALNALLVFKIVFRLTKNVGLAWLAGCFFGIHPIQVEAVVWAANRKDTLSLLFGLISIYIYILGTKAARPPFKHWILSILCLIIGMGAKPTVMVIPSIILVFEIFFIKSPVKKIWVFQLIANGIVGFFIIVTYPLALADNAVDPVLGWALSKHFSFFAYLYIYFIKLAVFPFNLSGLYLISSERIFDLPAIAIVCAGGGFLFYLIKNLKNLSSFSVQKKSILCGGLIYLGGLLEYTNIVSRHIYLADRYQYLSFLGFSLMFSGFVCLIGSLKLRLKVSVFFISAWIILTMVRVYDWKSSSSFWIDVDNKRNISLHQKRVNLGDAYAFERNWKRSADEFLKTDYEQIGISRLFKMADIFQAAGEFSQAYRILFSIMEKGPMERRAFFRLVIMNLAQGDPDSAERVLKNFENRFPDWLTTGLKDIIHLDRTGEKEKAFEKLYTIRKKINSSPQL
jgi:protein O-mannosyl-transferase